MPRKNIFDIVGNIFDVSIELKRMHRLFEQIIMIPSYPVDVTLRKYMYIDGFSTWKNRGRCVDLNDFLSLLDYENLWNNAKTDVQDLFVLIEIIYNFWHIANNNTNIWREYSDNSRNFRLLRKIMDDCLAHYNYKGEYFPDAQQLIVIEDKPEATAVAELVDAEIGRKVLRYNHYMLKGDLETKKDILLALGADLEPKREQIKAIDKNVEDGIFYMLNNLHLRHNNKAEGDKHYKQAVAEMDDQTLENWYDELYQMMLLAYLQLDQVDRNAKVKTLKQTVNSK